MTASLKQRLQTSLFALRVGVFLVMLMWTLDKFVNTEHSLKVWEHFYFIPNLGESILYIIGSVQMIVILMFLVGILKRFSYGAVLVLHSISTFSSFKQYMNPFENLLFFAAWPMLAACLGLYLLRDEDKLLSMNK